MWKLVSHKEHKLKMPEKNSLKGICGPIRQNVRGEDSENYINSNLKICAVNMAIICLT
jgi:hypothetical protein